MVDVRASGPLPEPVELIDADLDHVAGGAGQTWYDQQMNGGGHTPNGEANGVPTYTYNNGGHLKS